MRRSGLSIKLIALLLSAAVLAACGQKGPLYMPDDEQQEEQEEREKRG